MPLISFSLVFLIDMVAVFGSLDLLLVTRNQGWGATRVGRFFVYLEQLRLLAGAISYVGA